METLQIYDIRIGVVLPNKENWHKPLLLGQIVHYLTDIMAEETPLKSIGCAWIWQEVIPYLSLILEYNLWPSCVAVWNEMVVSLYFSRSMCLQRKDTAVEAKSWLRLWTKI